LTLTTRAAGFRDLGLGRIVGNPTNASVIATGSYGLVNGVNLENDGVAPDVFVRNMPEDELKGFDRELKTAVDEALKMLKEKVWRFGEK
jgi:tricorn protease